MSNNDKQKNKKITETEYNEGVIDPFSGEYILPPAGQTGDWDYEGAGFTVVDDVTGKPINATDDTLPGSGPKEEDPYKPTPDDFTQWRIPDTKELQRKFLDTNIIRNQNGIIEIHLDDPLKDKLRIPPLVNKIDPVSYLNAVDIEFNWFIPPVPIIPEVIEEEEEEIEEPILPTLPEGTLFKSPESPSVYIWYQGRPRIIPGQRFTIGAQPVPAPASPEPPDLTGPIQQKIASVVNRIQSFLPKLYTAIDFRVRMPVVPFARVYIIQPASKRLAIKTALSRLDVDAALAAIGGALTVLTKHVPVVAGYIDQLRVNINAYKEYRQELANFQNQAANSGGSLPPPAGPPFDSGYSFIPGIQDRVYYIDTMGIRCEMVKDVVDEWDPAKGKIPTLFDIIKESYGREVIKIAPEEFDELLLNEGSIAVYNYNPIWNTSIIMTEEDVADAIKAGNDLSGKDANTGGTSTVINWPNGETTITGGGTFGPGDAAFQELMRHVIHFPSGLASPMIAIQSYDPNGNEQTSIVPKPTKGFSVGMILNDGAEQMGIGNEWTLEEDSSSPNGSFCKRLSIGWQY